jgi:autotransporter translocation and assembly factor TamB
LPAAIAGLAAERINGIVKVGSIDTTPSGVILLRDVSISSADSKDPQPMISAPVVRITADIRGLISGLEPLQSIKRIDIDQPELRLERLGHGKWNVSNLLKPSKKRRAALPNAIVNVTRCRVIMKDFSNPNRIVVNSADGIHGILTLGTTLDCDFTGKGTPGRIGNVRVMAHYRPVDKTYSIEVEAHEADAKFWASYPVTLNLNILSGKAHVVARMSRLVASKPIRYTAYVNVAGGEIKFDQVRHPFTNGTGTLLVEDGVIGMHMRGNLGRTPVSVHGYLIGLHNPRVMIVASSDRADLKEIVGYTRVASQFAGVGLPHTGNAEIRFVGVPGSMGEDFAIRSPWVTYAGHHFASPEVRGVYYKQCIRVDSAVGDIYGGRIRFSGSVDLTKRPSVVLDGDFHEIDVAQIPVAAKWQVRGSAHGLFQATWTRGDLMVHCRSAMASGRVKDFSFDDASAEGTYTNGDVDIQEAGANVMGGLIGVMGSVSRDDRVALQVAGSGIDLASAGSIFSSRQATGRAQFSGSIEGSLENPTFTGQVEAYKAIVGGFGVDRITGRISANRSRVELSKVNAYSYPGSLSISGSVNSPLSSAALLDLNVTAENVPLSRYATDLRNVPADGSGSASIHISGLLVNPKADGKVTVTNGSVRNFPVDLAEAGFTYADRTLKIASLTAKSRKMMFSAQGQILPDGQMSGEFKGTAISLGGLNSFTRPYAAFSGSANVSGSVSGTRKHPVVEASLDCPNPSINGQAFESVSASGVWKGDEGITASLKLVDGKSEYGVHRIAYNPGKRIVQIDTSIHEGSGDRIARVLITSPYLRSRVRTIPFLAEALNSPDGSVSGMIDAGVVGDFAFGSGKWIPNLTCSVTASDVKYGADFVKTLRIEGSCRGDTLKLDKFEAKSVETNVSASGTVGPNDGLNVRFDAHNFSVDSLRPWVKLPDSFSGRADVTLVAGGSLTSPEGEASVECMDPVIAGVRFDRLRARLSMTGAQNGAEPGVRVNEIMLMLGGQTMIASGFIPMDWRTLSIADGRGMSLETDVNAGSLSVLSSFSGMRLETAQGGSCSGQVKLTGTRRSPEIHGNLNWSKGEIHVPHLDSTLENVKANLSLDGDKLSVESITGNSSDGGSFDIKGQVLLSTSKPTTDISVHASDLELSERDLSNNYGEQAKLRVNADLGITGDLRSPLVSGNVNVPEGYLSLMGNEVPSNGTAMKTANARLGLTISIGSKFEFRSSRFRAPLYGKLSVGGSVARPIVDGTADISNGRILFPMRQLRILPGSTLVLHVAPPDPPVAYIDMTAEGRLSSALLTSSQPRDYTIDMVAKGTLDKISPKFSSTPGNLSQQDIVGLLTGQQQVETAFMGKSGDFTKLFENAVVPTLFQTVGDAFQDVLGLDEFGVETGYNEPTRLTIGHRLWGDFYLDYSRVVNAPLDYTNSLNQLTLSYRLRQGLEVNIGTDTIGMPSFGFQGRRSF